MASRFNINPPEPVKRLPLPPTEGFESDDELEIFAKSLKLEDYKGSFDTSLQRLALRIPASEANTLIRNKDLKEWVLENMIRSDLEVYRRGGSKWEAEDRDRQEGKKREERQIKKDAAGFTDCIVKQTSRQKPYFKSDLIFQVSK